MRKFLIVAAVVAMTFASTQNAEAARRRGLFNRSPSRSRMVWQSPTNGGGFFSRLMELERRKNAMIFGR